MLKLLTRTKEPQLSLTYTDSGLTVPASRPSTLPRGLRTRTPGIARSALDSFLWFLGAAWHWIASMLLVGVLGGLGFGAWHVLMASPFFQLAEVQVVGAGDRLEGEIEDLVELTDDRGINLLLLRASELEARVAAHPRVAWAEVQKVYPGILQISVQEREPVAILATSPMYLLDAEGYAIEEIDAGGFGEIADFPFVSGVSGAAVSLGRHVDDPAIDALLLGWRVLERAESKLCPDIAELHAAGGDSGLEFVLNSGTRVRLGDRFTPEALAALESLAQESSSLDAFEMIDLRFRGQIVYRLRGILPGEEEAS